MLILGDSDLVAERGILNRHRYPDEPSIKAMDDIKKKWVNVIKILEEDDIIFLTNTMDSRISRHIRSSLDRIPHKNIRELIDFWNIYVPSFIQSMPNSMTKNTIEYQMAKSMETIRFSPKDMLMAMDFATHEERFNHIQIKP